jgi:hypothetical protein
MERDILTTGCPCTGDSDGKHIDGPVGAHTAVMLECGDILFGIVPTCRACNNYNRGHSRDFRPRASMYMVSLYRHKITRDHFSRLLKSQFTAELLSDIFFQDLLEKTDYAPDHVKCYSLYCATPRAA